MAYPTVSMDDDDDVVYLLSKGTGTSVRSVEMEVAVDVRTGTLRGVAKLDTNRHVGFLRRCLGSGISKYLNTIGIPTVYPPCFDGTIMLSYLCSMI